MVKINLEFEEVLIAFENCNVTHTYFIDSKENRLLDINDYIDDTKEIEKKERQLEAERERFIALPIRLPADEYRFMESFVYAIDNEKAQEKLEAALNQRKPFRYFKSALFNYPHLREQWFQYRDKLIKNEFIGWLASEGIELKGQEHHFPDIKIKESEPKYFPRDWQGFSPRACLKCGSPDLVSKVFLVNKEPENSFEEKQVKKIMKEQFNIAQFGTLAGGKESFLTAAQCKKCGSEDIFWDF